MAKKIRTFKRDIGQRRYRKLFVIASEGVKTELQYFAFFNTQSSTIFVKCLKRNHDSAPLYILKRMKAYLKQKELKKTDEAWLVLDKDHWTDEQLSELHQWSKENKNYGLALSNPRFEYWLLLHFEEGNNIQNSNECTKRLEKYMPNYDKDFRSNTINNEQISKAISRAKNRDNPPTVDWPRSHGTTVYKLVENILKP